MDSIKNQQQNMPFYKAFIFIVISLVSLFAKAQTMVSINDATVAIAPSYTVTNGTFFTVMGSVKNVGTTNINNNTVHVHLAIDTSSTSTPKYYLRSTHSYSVTNFLPSQTFTFDVSDNADVANSYNIDGGGTTVVIWGVVGFPTNDTTTFDSVKTTIYVLPLPQSITEMELFEGELNKLPNPITQNIQFTNTENYTIELINISGKTIEIKNSKLEIQNYYNGLYILRFRDKQGNETSKKIIISK